MKIIEYFIPTALRSNYVHPHIRLLRLIDMVEERVRCLEAKERVREKAAKESSEGLS